MPKERKCLKSSTVSVIGDKLVGKDRNQVEQAIKQHWEGTNHELIGVGECGAEYISYGASVWVTKPDGGGEED